MLKGILAPIRAIGFLNKNKGLIKYCVVPFIINAVIFLIFTYSAFNWLPGILKSFLPESSGSLMQIAYYSLIIVTFALILLIAVACFSIVGNIIAAPFNDLLTQNVEAIVLNISSDEKSFQLNDLIKIAIGLREEFKKICFVILIFIVLLPLNLVPLAGQSLYLFLNGTVVAITLGLEFFSYSLDRRDYSFKEKLRFIKIRFFELLGVGLSAWALLLIPIINFSILPLSAIGATLCFCEFEQKKGKDHSKRKKTGKRTVYLK